jgi:hypothetical protein
VPSVQLTPHSSIGITPQSSFAISPQSSLTDRLGSTLHTSLRITPQSSLTDRQAAAVHGTSPLRDSAAGSLMASAAAAAAAAQAVVSLDYVARARLLAVVLEDGRVALCRASDGGLSPIDQLHLSHYVRRRGSGAVIAKIGA